MDDLFRSAAENYQLKNGNDWDKIAPLIAGSETSAIATATPKSRKPWLILLALLIISPLLFITFNREKSNQQSPAVAINNSDVLTVNPDQQTSALVPKNHSENPNHTNFSERSLIENGSNSTDGLSKTKNIAFEINNRSESDLIEQKQQIEEIPAKDHQVQTVDFSGKHEFQIPGKVNKTLNPLINTKLITEASIPVTKSPEIRGLYLGILSGPQWNQVEGQGYNKTGFNLGLIAGFSFNKRLAVESGISYSKKYYYSDGQYFHMKKNPGTPTMKVISLEGSSNVIEIPAKIKYDVIDNKKGELFITAGLSTYILTKENNQYYALINGTPQNSNVIYNDRKTYLAGGMNLSAGYSIHLKKKTDIRIEPYLQIPFKGTGVGSMRVTTTGLNIGITRNFHK
jgi:hypothetical protein